MIPARRRRIWLLALSVLFAAPAGVLVVALVGDDPVTPETAARIRVGMTRAEVEGLLGRQDGRGGRRNGGTKAAWVGPRGAIIVHYGADGRVTEKEFKETKTTAVERALIRAQDRLKDWGE